MLGSKTVIGVAFLIAAACIGCSTSPLENNHGTEVYTKVGMWINDGRHMTSNYEKGIFLPPNTKLVVHSSSNNSIDLRIPDKRDRFKLVNRHDHTKLNIEEIYDRYFSETPINTNNLQDFEVEAIQEGRIIEGMTKQATLLARGYPPVHRTPSVERDEWIYWKTPTDRIRVEFEKNKVKYIID